METTTDSLNGIAPDSRGYGHAPAADHKRVKALIDHLIIWNQTGLVDSLIKADMGGELPEDLRGWSDSYDEAISGAGSLCVDLPGGDRWEGTEEQRDALVEELREAADDEEDEERADALRDDADALEDAESDGAEIYQWYLLSGGHYNDDLRALGEVVLESPEGDYYFGRQCCGQSMDMDGTFWALAARLEILEGQRHEWSAED